MPPRVGALQWHPVWRAESVNTTPATVHFCRHEPG